MVCIILQKVEKLQIVINNYYDFFFAIYLAKRQKEPGSVAVVQACHFSSA